MREPALESMANEDSDFNAYLISEMRPSIARWTTSSSCSFAFFLGSRSEAGTWWWWAFYNRKIGNLRATSRRHRGWAPRKLLDERTTWFETSGVAPQLYTPQERAPIAAKIAVGRRSFQGSAAPLSRPDYITRDLLLRGWPITLPSGSMNLFSYRWRNLLTTRYLSPNNTPLRYSNE